jgi:hypothetical protein
MSKDNKEYPSTLEDAIAEINQLSDSLDKVNAKIAEYDEKFANMQAEVKSSISVADKSAAKPAPITDPGEVTIDGNKYRFTSLRFKVLLKGSVQTVLASEAAKDKELLAELLKMDTGLFQAVKVK